MVLVLMAYQTLAQRSIRLFHCVDVKTIDQPRLFVDGDVVCYQGWQWVVLVAFLLVIFPFPGYLYCWRSKTRDQANPSETHQKINSILESAYADHAKWWQYIVLYRRLILVMVSTFASSFTKTILSTINVLSNDQKERIVFLRMHSS